MLVKHCQILDPTWGVLSKADVDSSSPLIWGRLLALGGAEGYCFFLPYSGPGIAPASSPAETDMKASIALILWYS